MHTSSRGFGLGWVTGAVGTGAESAGGDAEAVGGGAEAAVGNAEAEGRGAETAGGNAESRGAGGGGGVGWGAVAASSPPCKAVGGGGVGPILVGAPPFFFPFPCGAGVFKKIVT